MVQNLNNNLITAPELSDLRKRLRNLDSRVSNIENLKLKKKKYLTHILSRRARCSLWLSSGHGAITPFLHSPYVSLLKRMSMPTTYYKSCGYTLYPLLVIP